MTQIESFPIPSLIQGISQQAEASRGLASAEDQENCLNSVLDGVVSRMGSRVRKALTSTSYSNPFCHIIERSEDELYLVVIEGTSLRVFNLAADTEASVSGSITSYLSHTGASRKAFAACTVEDTTFIANRQKVTAMDSTTTSARANDALAFFKAGFYSTWYQMTIGIVGASSYSASFQTPDNSTPANAQYIDTSYLASQFEAAFNSTIAPALSSAGHGTFTISRNGSSLKVSGPTGKDYWIDTWDGQGDKQFISFKDKVRAFTDLPVRCFEGYKVAVAGDNKEVEDDYYLEFVGESPSAGVWEEIVAWSTEYQLDEDTMPQVLVNTAVDTFTIGPASWGIRVSGDAVYTSLDPNFIGKAILDVQFYAGRLELSTLGQSMLSKAGNAYVFFPDTSQTRLDSDPIGYDIANGQVTLLKRGVVAGGKLQLWAGTSQMVLESGQDALREDTADIRPMSSYKYDGEVTPEPLGLSSLMFGTTNGRWGRVTEVFFRGGQADGEIIITAHCPRLIDGKMRVLSVSEEKALVMTDAYDNRLYLYEWFNNGEERVQSAWHPWRFPAPSKLLWAGLVGDTMYLLNQWPNSKVTIESIQLDSLGDESDQTIPLRLDHRVSETSAAQDMDGNWVITLPYEVPSAKRSTFTCVERLDVEDDTIRGRTLDWEWVSDTQAKVLDTRADLKFFFGSIPTARRKFSRFHLQDDRGPVLPERLLIHDIIVSHEDTVSYDIEVTRHGGDTVTQPYNGRVLGDPSLLNREVKLATENFKADVGEISKSVVIELVNPYVFPCRWTAAEYNYTVTKRANR